MDFFEHAALLVTGSCLMDGEVGMLSKLELKEWRNLILPCYSPGPRLHLIFIRLL